MDAASPSPPPDPPEHGYTVPPSAPVPAAGPDAGDRLVPPPYGGVRFWWERVTGLMQLRGSRLAPIFLLTVAVPQFALAVVAEVLAEGLLLSTSGGIPLSGDGPEFTIAGGLVLFTLASVVGQALLSALGWGAGLWAVTQAAAQQPVTMAAAFQAGLRRLLPMFGWFLLYGLLVLVGLVLLVLPGIYLAVAGSLFSAVVLFEPGRAALRRSFALVHQNFGAALGRVLLLFLIALVVLCLVGCCTGFMGLTETANSAGARLAGNAIDALVAVPLQMFLLVGLLVTYAQLRCRREPISTGQLWAAANAHPAGGPPGYPGHPG